MTADSKNIVICLDGTGNEYGVDKTNVVRTCEIATCDDSQLVYYDPGVGTGGLIARKLTRRIKNFWGSATGGGLQQNVEDAYRFLMKNWNLGDKIFLLGFSRGAFTARSLAGMLHRCGLLRPYLGNLMEYASKIYNQKSGNLAAGFKSDFARPCPVHFIGVWDTVGSLAVFADEKFHDYRLNPETKYAYHAVALDEKRRKFAPCMWDEANLSEGQTMEQVWFAGSHSDVGGSYEERGLSDIALRWMLTKAQSCGMSLDKDKFASLKSDPLAPQHDEFWTPKWFFLGTHKRQPKPKAKVHQSVQERMAKTEYKPVKPLPDSVEWVD